MSLSTLSTENLIELLTLISSILTPIVLIFFGVFINKNLEKSKHTLNKEIEWQKWWANKFLEKCQTYNDTVSDIVVYANLITKQGNIKGFEEDLNNNFRIMEKMDWEIKNYAKFAEKCGSDVIRRNTELFNLISSLFTNKKGDLEEIRTKQFLFNQHVRSAHAELLTLR